MDDEAALLSAIERHPDDDTPRLAYADWLDEHARPVRAEFIRLQCAIAGLDTASQVVRNANVELWRRQQELLDDHRDELLGPLADVLGEHDVEFTRGFVSKIEMGAERFVEYAEAVAALQPLPDVAVSDVAWWLDRFEDVPDSFKVATSIEMQSTRRPAAIVLVSDAMRLFVGRGPWNRLRELSLEWCQIEDDGIAELVSGDRFPSLAQLDLSANQINDPGVELLVGSPLFARIRMLVLGANPITDEGARLLATAPGRLEYLNMKHTEITPEGQQALLRRKGCKVDLF